MSLILEALRKSEAERRRAQAPDLFAEPQLALPRPQPTWPGWAKPALAGVGLIALLVLVRVMWPQTTSVATTQIPQASPPMPVAKPMPVVKPGTTPSAPREPVPVQATSAAAAPAQSIPQPVSPPEPAPTRPEQARPAPAVAATPAFEQPRMPPQPVIAADTAA